MYNKVVEALVVKFPIFKNEICKVLSMVLLNYHFNHCYNNLKNVAGIFEKIAILAYEVLSPAKQKR